jgi:anthranilate synthase component 1
MLRPDEKEFHRLAKTATLVPVVKTVPADMLTPVSAFLGVARARKYAFLLESVEGGEQIGRYTFLGADPYMVLRAHGNRITLERGRKRVTVEGDVFQTVRSLLREHTPAHLPGLPPFTSGAVGFFAYDAVRQLEPVPRLAAADVPVPDCVLMFFDRLLAFDHVRHQIHIIASADVRNTDLRRAYGRAVRDIEVLEVKLFRGDFRARRKASRPLSSRKLKVKTIPSQKQFKHNVERAREYIAAGDIFQVVLSQRTEFVPGADAFSIYRALRALNPSPYMYYLRLKDLEVLGSSPEMLVKVQGEKLRYRPIAGTRPRGASDEQDRRMEQELRSDEKERAEHVMLVDLGRNDLGRVSQYGSVKVQELMTVERYSHVMHLVSALESKLRPELSPLEAFAACFPAGTLSGAPKVRAMQIIEELEPVRRGLYGGSVLYADFAGNLDSCIAIRTLLLCKGRAYVQAGAGIVADSDPQKEYEECNNKAEALLLAAQQARDMQER